MLREREMKRDYVKKYFNENNFCLIFKLKKIKTVVFGYILKSYV